MDGSNNPLENVVIDNDNNLIFDINSLGEDDELTQDFIENLYNNGEFHSFCCMCLGLGYIFYDLESLKDVNNKYPVFKKATDEFYNILKDLGWLEKAGAVFKVRDVKKIIGLYVGTLPIYKAVKEELQEKREAIKKAENTNNNQEVVKN